MQNNDRWMNNEESKSMTRTNREGRQSTELMRSRQNLTAYNWRGSLMKRFSAILFPLLIPSLQSRHMCVCVLHFHCCQSTRLGLCGIWDSGPARTDLDLQLKTLAQEKSESRSNTWNNDVPTFIFPANKGLTPPTHKALAASFILFQMFSNLLLTLRGGGWIIITHAVAPCSSSIMLSAISLLCSWRLNYKYFWRHLNQSSSLRRCCVCMCAVVLTGCAAFGLLDTQLWSQ